MVRVALAALLLLHFIMVALAAPVVMTNYDSYRTMLEGNFTERKEATNFDRVCKCQCKDLETPLPNSQG